jgi:hypothetical protein
MIQPAWVERGRIIKGNLFSLKFEEEIFLKDLLSGQRKIIDIQVGAMISNWFAQIIKGMQIDHCYGEPDTSKVSPDPYELA